MGTVEAPDLEARLKAAFAPEAAGPWSLAATAVAGDASARWLSSATDGSGFDVGSVTETLTALLLATMVQQGRVSLDDEVSRYLPAAAGAPTTLLQLATHTAGYPRIPLRLKWRMLPRLRDPYSRLRDRDVDKALLRFSRKIVAGQHEPVYSNFGYGVLSRALAVAGGAPFETLLRQEVLRPLHLRSTTFFSEPGKGRLFGHDLAGKEMEHWHNPALPGAGCLFSTVADMHRYLLANLRPGGTDLAKPVEMAQELLLAPAEEQRSLGWFARQTDQGTVYWHNGGSAGFGTFLAFDVGRHAGVAVLISRCHDPSLDEAAMALMAQI